MKLLLITQAYENRRLGMFANLVTFLEQNGCQITVVTNDFDPLITRKRTNRLVKVPGFKTKSNYFTIRIIQIFINTLLKSIFSFFSLNLTC